MSKNKKTQEQNESIWDRAYKAVQQARATDSEANMSKIEMNKIDMKEFARLTKSAGGNC